MAEDEDLIRIPFSMNSSTFVTMADGLINYTDTPINTTEAANDRDETLAKVEISILAIILYLALFGNIVVIAILLRRTTKLTRMQLFIIHLAIADISVALCQVLPQLIMDITFRFHGNNFLCKLVKYVQVLTMYSSTYVLIVTALDRYVSICHPLTSQTWTSRRVHVMSLLAWIISFIFAIPQLVLFSYKPGYKGIHDCLDNFDLDKYPWHLKAYITWIFVSVYFVPFLILTGCYSKICYIVWISVNAKENPQKQVKKSSRKLLKSDSTKESHDQTSFKNPRAHSKRLSKSKIKTVKLTLAVILCFLICWAPFFITQMWSAFDENAPYYTSHIMAVIVLLASLNSCTNPWIYLAFSGRMCKKRRRNMTKTWTSTAHSYMNDSTDVTRVRGESIALTSRLTRDGSRQRATCDI